MEIKGYLFSVIYASICLLLGFFLYKIGVSKKITRKLVHILVGFEWIILYVYMKASIHFLVVCLIFLAILAFSYRKRLLPMIASDGENSPGTVYYAVAMSIMAFVCLFIPDMLLPFGIGVLCTSLGDGLAGLAGQCINPKYNLKVYKNKTIIGIIVNFFVCIASVYLFNAYFVLGMKFWHIVVIAIFATELELFTGKGLDNISITLGTSFLSYMLINLQGSENYLLPILLTPIIIVFANDKKALTVDGIIAALFVGIVISVTLGNIGFLLLLTFFIIGIITDKIKKRYKKTKQKEVSRTECRDSLQVVSNSGIAVMCSLLYFLTSEKAFLVAFVAAIGEALADTAASGIGVLSGKAFDPFRMRECPVGISGGMSILGTASSLLGATLISLIAFAFGNFSIIDALVAIACGFLGAVFDSFLGSFAQIKYKCNICDRVVEKKVHCGEKTLKHSGFGFVTNDTVNFLGTFFAATLSYLLIIFT